MEKIPFARSMATYYGSECVLIWSAKILYPAQQLQLGLLLEFAEAHYHLQKSSCFSNFFVEARLVI